MTFLGCRTLHPSFFRLSSSFGADIPHNGQYVALYNARCAILLWNETLTIVTESKNSSQHNQSRKAHRNGYAPSSTETPRLKS
jgi:hypothetical protein